MDNKFLQKQFFAALKDTYGETLENFKNTTPEDLRVALRDNWEQDLRDRGLPSLELANLVALSTLLPLMQVTQEVSYEDFQNTLSAQILVLIDDILNPNR